MGNGRPLNELDDRLLGLATSSRGRLVYALRGDRTVVAFDLENGGAIEGEISVMADKPKYLCHAIAAHPHRNQLSTAGTDGALRVWSA